MMEWGIATMISQVTNAPNGHMPSAITYGLAIVLFVVCIAVVFAAVVDIVRKGVRTAHVALVLPCLAIAVLLVLGQEALRTLASATKEIVSLVENAQKSVDESNRTVEDARMAAERAAQAAWTAGTRATLAEARAADAIDRAEHSRAFTQATKSLLSPEANDEQFSIALELAQTDSEKRFVVQMYGINNPVQALQWANNPTNQSFFDDLQYLNALKTRVPQQQPEYGNIIKMEQLEQFQKVAKDPEQEQPG